MKAIQEQSDVRCTEAGYKFCEARNKNFVING